MGAMWLLGEGERHAFVKQIRYVKLYLEVIAKDEEIAQFFSASLIHQCKIIGSKVNVSNLYCQHWHCLPSN